MRITQHVEYTYDVHDRRIAKDIDSDGDLTFDAEERFIHDGEHILLAFDETSATSRYLYGPGIDQVLAEERLGVTLTGPSGDSSYPETFDSTGSGIPWTITPYTGGSVVLDDVYGDPVDVTLNSANLILDGQIDRAIWTQGGLEFVPMGSSGQFILGAESIEDLTGADLEGDFGIALTVSGAGNTSQVLEISGAYFYDIPSTALVTDITFTLDVDNTGWGTFEVSNVSVSVTYYEATYGPETYWALADHQGTVRDLVEYDTDHDEAVERHHIRYDAFGRIMSESEPEHEIRFGYTGRDYDPETGLNYYRARYYDASMGQFLSEDPIGFAAGDVNVRRYVGNDPVNKVDPSGNFGGPYAQKTRSGWKPGWEYGAKAPKPKTRQIVGRNDARLPSDFTLEGNRLLFEGVEIARKWRDWFVFRGGGDAHIAVTPEAMQQFCTNGVRFKKPMEKSENALARLWAEARAIQAPMIFPRDAQNLGIFMDGTTNSVYDMTNVSRLYAFYQGAKFYYAGVGNPIDFSKDRWSGAWLMPFWWGNEFASGGAFGLFRDTIIQRAKSDVLGTQATGNIEQLHIFGFSRGAAMSVDLAWALEPQKVTVHFLGLFDPVYSYDWSGDGSTGHTQDLYSDDPENNFEWYQSWQWKAVSGSPYTRDGSGIKTTYHQSRVTRPEYYVNYALPKNVQKAVVLYAMHEQREAFPWTRFYNVDGNGMKDGKSYSHKLGKGTQLEAYLTPGGHGEAGGHWQSNQDAILLSLYTMLAKAREHGAVFGDKMDDEIQQIIFSEYAQEYAPCSEMPDTDFTFEEWKKQVRNLENWKLPTEEEFVDALKSLKKKDLEPGAYGDAFDAHGKNLHDFIPRKFPKNYANGSSIVPGANQQLYDDAKTWQHKKIHSEGNTEWVE